MKLSEIKNEQALEVLAEIIEPISKIAGDETIKNELKNGTTLAKQAKYILKTYKSEVMDILAALECTPRNEYTCDLVSLPVKLLELLNDADLISAFTSAAASAVQTSSGSQSGTAAEKI